MSNTLNPLPYIEDYAEIAFDMIMESVDVEPFNMESLNVIANVYYRGIFISGMPQYIFDDSIMEDLKLRNEFSVQFKHINEYVDAVAKALRKLSLSKSPASDAISDRLQDDMIDMFKYRIDTNKIKRPIFRGGKRKSAKIFDIENLFEKMFDDFSNKYR